MNARSTAVVIRSVSGTAAVEWFLVFAIGTILVTRASLAAAGYPQVGGGSLHIAHALWGGALMMLALITGWLFLGSTPRILAIIMGGIGFGLFLDEVGKFVTKTNNYFYKPSVEIMFILIIIVLLIGRIVRDLRPPTVTEAIGNAATIAADGVAHGLPDHRRRQATEFLAFAEGKGGDEAVIADIRRLLDSSRQNHDRLVGAQTRLARLVPRGIERPVWAAIVGWVLIGVALVTVVVGILAWYLRDRDHHIVDLYLKVSENPAANRILVIAGAITVVCGLVAVIATNRTTRLWPLRLLRFAALLFVLSNALVDFALEGFGGLINLAIGLVAMILLGVQVGARTREQAVEGNHSELRV